MSIDVNGGRGIKQNTTASTKIPVGTTAQRPENPEAGMIRFNTDEGYVEWYDDVADIWASISLIPVAATGGTVTDITQDGINYRVHTFTSDGTFEVTRGGEVEYLVVAGGGGGGSEVSTNAGAGGGGAGGYRCSVISESTGGGLSAESPLSLMQQAYAITVGDGGAGSATGQNDGTKGQDSSISDLVIATGGGAGRTRSNTSAGGANINGGSGGGGGYNTSGGSGIAGQGFDGGTGSSGGNFPGGGGGGAGSSGGNAPSSSIAGDGGSGVFSSITGTSTERAGGGSGGGNGASASGGGGASTGNNTNGTAGTANTGGGGSGAHDQPGSGRPGGNGGSGIVIVRYRIG